MKIGILTLPLHVNYGGILQAYALQTVLESMGHEVWIIKEKRYKHPSYLMPLVYLKRIIRKYLKGEKTLVFNEFHENRIYSVIGQHIIPFVEKYIKSFEVRNLENICETDFDAIVVGSDQIWRPLYYSQIAHAFLDFSVGWNIKRLSYAASFGTDDWEYTSEQTKLCANLLQRFDSVTVREDVGVDFCKKYFCTNAQQVLDPTMLLNIEDYIAVFKKADVSESSGNLLCYILDETEEKQMVVDEISKQYSLSPFRVNSKAENINALLEERIQPSVEKFLRGFYDAEFVITDSFHACVFSILFNKPFIVYGNKQRGLARFSSLLKMFELEKLLITSLDELNTVIIDVDWIIINDKIQQYKEYSKNQLLNTLRYV